MKPKPKAIIPEAKERRKRFNAIKNLNCTNKSNKSYTNEEKVLKLPKKPIEQNNIKW